MISAIFVGLYHIHQQPRQIGRIGRRAYLIVHHGHCAALLPQPEHGFDEVRAVHAEYPRDAHYEVFFGQLLYGELSLILHLPVDIERAAVRIVRLPRLISLAVENIVRADIHHRHIQLAAHPRDIARAVGIDPSYQLRLVLGSVHRDICRAVDDGIVGSLLHQLLHDALHRLRVRDIHLGHARAYRLYAARCALSHQIGAQLPLRARDQYPHSLSPYILSKYLVYSPLMIFFHQSSFSRYHLIVAAMPLSKSYSGFQPSSFMIFVGSIA